MRSEPYRCGRGHAPDADEFERPDAFGGGGLGKWITIYARNGHAFAVIAGLRLDTTASDDRGDRYAPRWRKTLRAPSGFELSLSPWSCPSWLMSVFP